MLRRRRSTIGIAAVAEEQPHELPKKRRDDIVKTKMNKLKMSPFPEMTRSYLKDGCLSDVKISLEFEQEKSPGVGLAASDPVIPSATPIVDRITLRPSDVLEMQRQLTPKVTTQQPRKNGRSAEVQQEEDRATDSAPTSSSQPSVALKSMWDNVVSWMKMAVDFVAFDSPAEAEPLDMPLSARKRPLSDASNLEPKEKIPRLSFTSAAGKALVNKRKQSKRRMSFGGRWGAKNSSSSSDAGLGLLLSLEGIPEFKSSPDILESPPHKLSATSDVLQFQSPATILAGDLSRSLSVHSPRGSKVCSTAALLDSVKRFQSSNYGLNSILDGSPSKLVASYKKRIRHPALREFYGSSVNSPNLTGGVEISSADQKDKDETITAEDKSSTIKDVICGKVPPPPPPPPPPPLPKVPPPPPLSLKSRPSSEHGVLGVDTLSGIDQSRDVLQKMQHRLRNRIKKKGSDQSKDQEQATEGNTFKLDTRVQQWAEIQAHSRKMPLKDFLALAEKKKQELQTTLQQLQEGAPSSMVDVVITVELLQEACQWFPGGSKEMKDALPLYKNVERKVETLNEFVQITLQMENVCGKEQQQKACYSNVHHHLSCIREDFKTKHRHWGPIILTDAESWVKLGLPVSQTLIQEAQKHLCSLVVRFSGIALTEASKIGGILVSIKCVRTTQAKENLKECMCLLVEALPYFIKGESSETQEERSHTILLKLAMDVASVYIHICLQQFDGFICRVRRQEVCEHFEGILKIMNLLKSAITGIPSFDRKSVTGGMIGMLPDADGFGSLIYSSCVKLIEHLVAKAHSCLTSSGDQQNSKEIVLWMMFGCKYVNRTLEVLGSEQADEKGVQSLLASLQQMESLLPE